MKLSLGFSPCPNDTFIFDAMIHQKIDTEGLEFEVVMADVEALNQMAFNEKLDVTKLSYNAVAYCLQNYIVLNAGSALGNSCGPLLIAKKRLSDSEVETSTISIPGKYTTANFLLSLAFPKATQKVSTLFSEIENNVLNNTTDAGLIIHENRFTYEAKGLLKIIDLGEYWENRTGFPIPLGGIVVRRNFTDEQQQKINRVLRRSVEFAFQHPTESLQFTKLHAQEMSESVMQQHIKLYVNDFSVDLGEKGRLAVEKLFAIGTELNIIPAQSEKIFIN